MDEVGGGVKIMTLLGMLNMLLVLLLLGFLVGLRGKKAH
jgi:hypothetical protein